MWRDARLSGENTKLGRKAGKRAMEEQVRSENIELPVVSEILAGVEYDGIDGSLPAGTIIRVITSEELEKLKPMLINNGFIASNVFDDYNAQIQEEHIIPHDLPIEQGLLRETNAKQTLPSQMSNVDSGQSVRPHCEQARAAMSKTARGSVLPVKCKNTLGHLYKDKFGSGSRGKCIKYRRDWFTPREFEIQCGKAASKDWKRSIKSEGRRLNDLIKAGIISTHSPSCTCRACCDDESATGPILLCPPWKKRRSQEETKQNREGMKNCIITSLKTGIESHDCPKSPYHTQDEQTNDPRVNADQVLNGEKIEQRFIAEKFSTSTEVAKRTPDLIPTLKRLNDINQNVVLLVAQVKRCIADVKVLRARQLSLGQRQEMQGRNIEARTETAQVPPREYLADAKTKLIASDIISMVNSGA